MMFRDRGRTAPGGPARAAAGWRLMAGLAAAPVVVVSVFRAVPREWPTTVVQLVSFTPWLVLPASVSLLFAVLGRRRWMAGAAAAACGRTALLAGPAGLCCQGGPRRTPQGRSTSGDTLELRTMSLNAKLGKADAAEIVRLVRENGITLLDDPGIHPGSRRPAWCCRTGRAAPEQDQCPRGPRRRERCLLRPHSWNAPGQFPTPIFRCR